MAPEIDFWVGDAEALPFGDQSFSAGLVDIRRHVRRRARSRGARAGAGVSEGWSDRARELGPGGRGCGPVRRPAPVHARTDHRRTLAFEWGRPERLRELLGDASELRFKPGTTTLRMPDGPSVWKTFVAGFGPAKTLAANLDEAEPSSCAGTFISEDLRREINEGLNVIEQWNSANDFIFFARRGEMVSNRREDHEISMLALHLLQNCMVYINTLMLQRVLAQPHWSGKLTARDRGALTPLFWEHVNPYGRFELDMDARLPID